MEPKTFLKNLILEIARAVVDNHDAVAVAIRQGEQTTCFEIVVDKEDLGKILGKQGSMINAIRKIAQSYSTKHRFRAICEVVE